MRLFLALPVLSLLLGALANPLDLREPTPHGLDARQAVSDVCYPVSTGGVLLNQSKTGGSTFILYFRAECSSSCVLQCVSVTLILALSEAQFRPTTSAQSTT